MEDTLTTLSLTNYQPPEMSAKRYSLELRKIAYERIKQGEKLRDISDDLGIKISTLSSWKRVGELPSDYGKVAPSFRKNSPTIKKAEQEIFYRDLFNKLPLNNQRYAEHLRQQYRDGLIFAINYAKIILSRMPAEPVIKRQNLEREIINE